MVVRLLMGTMRYRIFLRGQKVHPADDLPGPMIYSFWHETFLFMAGLRSPRKACILISQSADGELIAQLVQRLGHKVARGSSTRGGAQGLWELVGAAADCHIAVTPDGPRGPRRTVKLGTVYLAARTGLSIVPVGIAYSKAWRLRSWDRFAVPCPFTRIVGVAGRVLHVPADLDREGIECYRQERESRMAEATARAEEWAGERGQGKLDQKAVPAQAKKVA